MRVIKPGERRKDFRWVQFECHEGGCIFEEAREKIEETYLTAMNREYGVLFEMRCPYCRAKASVFMEFGKDGNAENSREGT